MLRGERTLQRKKAGGGQLLAIPTEGYLEVAGGPILLRDIEWIDVSTSRVKGGIAGRPRQTVDMKDEILAGLQTIQLDWELRESTWSIPGVFEEEPVQVIRISNPFGPTSRQQAYSPRHAGEPINAVHEDCKLDFSLSQRKP